MLAVLPADVSDATRCAMILKQGGPPGSVWITTSAPRCREVLVVHRNAPLTETGRLRLARCIVEEGWPVRRALRGSRSRHDGGAVGGPLALVGRGGDG